MMLWYWERSIHKCDVLCSSTGEKWKYLCLIFEWRILASSRSAHYLTFTLTMLWYCERSILRNVRCRYGTKNNSNKEVYGMLVRIFFGNALTQCLGRTLPYAIWSFDWSILPGLWSRSTSWYARNRNWKSSS